MRFTFVTALRGHVQAVRERHRLDPLGFFRWRRKNLRQFGERADRKAQDESQDGDANRIADALNVHVRLQSLGLALRFAAPGYPNPDAA